MLSTSNYKYEVVEQLNTSRVIYRSVPESFSPLMPNTPPYRLLGSFQLGDIKMALEGRTASGSRICNVIKTFLHQP